MALIDEDDNHDDLARGLAIVGFGLGILNLMGLSGAASGSGAAVPAAIPSGAAGGDLGGNYPNPTVQSLGGGGITSAAVIAQIPTVAQKAALVGTDGVPSGVNPYVTDSDPRNTDDRHPNTSLVPGTAAVDMGMVWIESAAVNTTYRRLWNFLAVLDPTVNDDSSAGYAPGAFWFNTTGQRLWYCNSNAVGAANWILCSPGSIQATALVSAGLFLAGPISGGAAVPFMRGIDAADIPALTRRLVEDGAAAAGPIAFPGALIGDLVIDVLGWISATGAMIAADQMPNFEASISVNGQIQQVAGGDLSLNRYRFLLQRQS